MAKAGAGCILVKAELAAVEVNGDVDVVDDVADTD
jgi:hypothetical protein